MGRLGFLGVAVSESHVRMCCWCFVGASVFQHKCFAGADFVPTLAILETGAERPIHANAVEELFLKCQSPMSSSAIATIHSYNRVSPICSS